MVIIRDLTKCTFCRLCGYINDIETAEAVEKLCPVGAIKVEEKNGKDER